MKKQWLHVCCLKKHPNLVYKRSTIVARRNKEVDLFTGRIMGNDVGFMVGKLDYLKFKDARKKCDWCKETGFTVKCLEKLCQTHFHPYCSVRDNKRNFDGHKWKDLCCVHAADHLSKKRTRKPQILSATKDQPELSFSAVKRKHKEF